MGAPSRARAADHALAPTGPGWLSGELSLGGSKADDCYRLHGYWAKKHPGAIARLLERFTRPGERVLDPFCGSGMTGVAALRTGRRAALVDASPAAALIAGETCRLPAARHFEEAAAWISRALARYIDPLYTVPCGGCGGPAELAHAVRRQADGELVELDTLCRRGCRPRRRRRLAQPADGRALLDLEQQLSAELASGARRGAPSRPMLDHPGPPGTPWGEEWRPSRDLRSVADLYTVRNGVALRALFELCAASAEPGAMRLLASSVALNASRLYRFRPSRKGGTHTGSYFLPPLFQEMNVGRLLAGKLAQARRVRALLPAQAPLVEVVQGDATRLEHVADRSIDYVFTDPPYAGLVQFGELNFPWEAWLEADGDWRSRELVVSASRGLRSEDFAAGLSCALGEIVRVLKPGRHATLAYHPRPRALAELEALASAAGLELVGRGQLELGQRSREQENGNLPALDALLHFRKP